MWRELESEDKYMWTGQSKREFPVSAKWEQAYHLPTSLSLLLQQISINVTNDHKPQWLKTAPIPYLPIQQIGSLKSALSVSLRCFLEAPGRIDQYKGLTVEANMLYMKNYKKTQCY